MNLTYKLLSGLLIPTLTLSCFSLPLCAGESSPAKTTAPLQCRPADDWTALFDRSGTRQGWLAADGIYSVALNGKDALSSANQDTNTAFIFSDTILGTAADDGNITRYNGMANHTAAILQGSLPATDSIEFFFGARGNQKLTGDLNLFSQNQWLFDCFVTGGSFYAFAFSQQNWKPSQIDLIKIPITDAGTLNFAKFKRTRNVRSLLKKLDDFDYAYGMGVLCNTQEAGAMAPDGYIYIYGYRDNFAAFSQKDLIVSRIAADAFPDFDQLRYWDGQEWVEDILQSKPVLERVSCEVSVTPISVGRFAGKYLAVYTQDVQSDRIMYAVGDSPAGPFDTPVQCYTVPETGDPATGGKGTLYTYNAKAHPHISPVGQLLISYNVNVNGDDHARNTADYRPRFIALDLEASEEEIRALQEAAAAPILPEDPAPAPVEPPVTGTDGGADGTAKAGPSWMLPALIGGAVLTTAGVTMGVLLGKRRKSRS